MKKIRMLLLIISVALLTACKNNEEVEGYWCNYEEKAVITVLIENNITDRVKENIEDTINTIENLDRYDFLLASNFDSTSSNEKMHDIYFIYLKNSDYLDDSVILLQNTKGVYSVSKNMNKENLNLYHLTKGTFTYQNDLTEEAEKIEGKYKIKNNKISFDNEKVTSIYIKDKFLCLDEGCNKILIETNSLCESN